MNQNLAVFGRNGTKTAVTAIMHRKTGQSQLLTSELFDDVQCLSVTVTFVTYIVNPTYGS